nr:hypothetical protein [Tanacetum cinerariifolium]
MVAILEKTEHNTDFHQIVDFLEASHLRYALTISPLSMFHIFDSFGPLLGSKQRIRKQKFLLQSMGEGSANPTEPHHTPSPQEQHSPHHDSTPPSHPIKTSEPIPQAPTEPLTHEPASLSRDDRQGEAFLIVSSLDAGQDRENIAKTSALPHDSSPRVTSLDADEGSMKQRIYELTELCTSLQRQQSQMVAKIKDQGQEISGLKAREELGADKSTELGRNETEEMVNVLSSLEAANILTSGGAAASVSPADVLSAAGIPTVSGSFPTPMRSPIIGAKDKGKQKVVEFEVPNNRKLQEQINAHVAKEIEEEFARENQMSNEVIAKQVKADLSVGEKIELINELVKYQDHRAILKYQTQQSKPLSKKEQREFYMSEDFMPMSSKEEGERVKRQGIKIDQRSTKRMKTSEDVSEEDLKGMMQLVPLEEVYIEALQVKHHIIDWEIHSEGKREEDLHQLWTLVKETLNIKQDTKDKEKELWVELKRLFEPNFEDQLWTHN